jgi:hypothetical protein
VKAGTALALYSLSKWINQGGFMKFFLIILIGAFVAFSPNNSFAATKNVTATSKDNWEEILLDKDLYVEQPDFAKDMGPEGIFNICASENEFRSVEPVGTCVDYKIIETAPDSTEFGLFPEYHCKNEAPGNVIVSRMSQEIVCAKSVRQEREDQNATCLEPRLEGKLPTKLNLNVLKRRGENKGTPVFIKEYEIPKC